MLVLIRPFIYIFVIRHIIWFSDFYLTQLSNYEANHVKYLLTLNSIDNLIIREPIRLNIALLNRTFCHQKINLLLENNVVVHFFDPLN